MLWKKTQICKEAKSQLIKHWFLSCRYVSVIDEHVQMIKISEGILHSEVKPVIMSLWPKKQIMEDQRILPPV